MKDGNKIVFAQIKLIISNLFLLGITKQNKFEHYRKFWKGNLDMPLITGLM